MTLLKRETDLLPPNVLELSETLQPWWVAHVRSRQEKALARHLTRSGVPFYLPLHEKSVRAAGRRLVSYLPLFPGYVFCRGTGAERVVAIRTNLVCQILEVREQRLLTQELSQLRLLQSSGAQLMPHVPLAPGDAVRIAQGAFQGYVGVVVRSGGRPRLVVSISMLRKAVTVEFDRAALAPAPTGFRPAVATRRVLTA
ncbi:MAG TPA: transcription termination/antitermination NusG family protein [Thermoanaerobaculia bacterium]|jgi:transcription antitermination factor NusG|nr:transcription termination/antitermination NusG family protein [Thermoanaerobaculia bacterium]